MPGIFISYRREDSAGHAGRLFDHLKPHFGKDRVFMDVAGIEPGMDFVEAIDRAVGSCEVLIVVVGKQWLTCLEPDGKRRLDNPNDFIRLEVATALRRNVRVIPVLVQGARMPKADELPGELERLARRQAVEVSDTRWDSDVDQLIKALESALHQETQPSVAQQPAALIAKEAGQRRVLPALTALAAMVLAILGWLFWPQPIEVPQVTGGSLESAQAVLAAHGFILGKVSEEPSESAASGTIVKQEPGPGTRAAKGAKVDIVVAVVVRVAVPEVVRQEYAAAEAVLARAGLRVGRKSTKASAELATGVVMNQNPTAGSSVARNTPVDLVVAVAQVAVPSVVRSHFQEAKSAIERAGLRVGEVAKREIFEPIREETVLEQNPRAQAKVDKGTTVNLVVSARPVTVTVPNLLGKALDEAKSLLAKSGLNPGSVQQSKSSRPAGTVLRQIPVGGERVGWGAKVNLTVALQADASESTQAVSIRSKGILTIPEGRSADLDEGVVGSRVNADIGFPLGNPAGRFVEPLNGASMAIVRSVSPDGKSCAAARLVSHRVSLADLQKGTLVCVRTNEGRTAYFRVMENVGPSPGQFRIGFVAWN